MEEYKYEPQQNTAVEYEAASRLSEIKDRLIKGEKVDGVTVRALLSWFGGARRRGWWLVQAIKAALEDNHLETVPDFNSVYIDYPVEFKLTRTNSRPSREETPDSKLNTSQQNGEQKTEETLSLIDDDPTYRLSRLEAANKSVVSVKPDSSLSEAITLMLHYDYSQLPVMQSARDLKGVISWRSIGQRLYINNTSSKVRELMEHNFQWIPADTSLFKAIPLIIEQDYILVKNKTNEVCGIVTASDLSLQFQESTESFLLVGEIENHIRQILTQLTIQELEKCKEERDTDRVIKTVADLNFGEYLRLCQNPDIWEKLSLKIDRNVFCSHMEEVRLIRNTIMHFDPDGLEEESKVELRNFVRLLQSLRNLGVF
jgi:CBS domain-containing protein